MEEEKKEDVKVPQLPVKFELRYKTHYQKDRTGKKPLVPQKMIARITPRKSSSRKPLNLCLVLDISVSMRKHLKMLQNAIEGLINSLTGKDKVHLVTFGSDAEVVFKEVLGGSHGLMVKARAAARLLRPKGTTNMMAGLELGKQVLEESQKIDSDSEDGMSVPLRRKCHMFVFCDGIVNKWPKKYPTKEQKNATIYKFVGDMSVKSKVTVSSFGFTCAFDSEFMKMISEVGAGHYYHVDGVMTTKDETNQIKICFQKEFRLASTARIDKSVLTIIPLNGCSVTRIYGFGSKYIKEGVPLGRLFDSDTRNILIDAVVAPVSSHMKPAFKLELRGIEIGESTEVELLGQIDALVELTDDPKKYNEVNDDVRIRSEWCQVVASAEGILTDLQSNVGDKDDQIEKALKLALKKLGPLRKLLMEAEFVYTQLNNCLKQFKNNYKSAIKILEHLKLLHSQSNATLDTWGFKKWGTSDDNKKVISKKEQKK